MKLYLFTDQYPYGPGEEAFLDPELELLAAAFEVVVVSQFKASKRSISDEKIEMPDEITSIHIPPPSLLQLIVRSVKAPISKVFRREWSNLIHEGITIKGVIHSLYEFSRADFFRAACKKEGIFDNCANSLFYTFWFNNECLALVMEKIDNPQMKIVSRIHRYDLFEDATFSKRQPFQKIMRDYTDKILFLSSAAERYFTKTYGGETHEDTYLQLGLGVPDCGLQPEQKQDSLFRLVSCSNTIPIKRVHIIAEALACLNADEYEWVHFGDGRCQEEIKQYCLDHDVNVQFRGHVSNDLISKFYRENYVDAFVTTSASEGVPVSIEEALSFGIPIIATDVGSIDEQIDQNGILLPSDSSAQQVSNAILEMRDLCEEEVLAMRMQSRRIWEEKFDSSRLRAHLVDLLLSLVAEDEGLN